MAPAHGALRPAVDKNDQWAVFRAGFKIERCVTRGFQGFFRNCRIVFVMHGKSLPIIVGVGRGGNRVASLKLAIGYHWEYCRKNV